ncbi:MAG: VTT domain-containing protein [Candidatus Bathyarchaeia archaeon]
MFDLLSFGYIGLFLLSFAFNMLPFMGPSNALLAGALAASLPWANPLLTGVLVALSASLAKLIHFLAAFFLRGALSSERKEKLDQYIGRRGNVGSLLLFIAAVTSIPDEPVVIPLGLVKYSPAKFFVIYLLGKILIAIPGAYIGSKIPLSDLVGSPIAAVLSICATIVVTYILMKIDLKKLIGKITIKTVEE